MSTGTAHACCKLAAPLLCTQASTHLILKSNTPSAMQILHVFPFSQTTPWDPMPANTPCGLQVENHAAKQWQGKLVVWVCEIWDMHGMQTMQPTAVDRQCTRSACSNRTMEPCHQQPSCSLPVHTQDNAAETKPPPVHLINGPTEQLPKCMETADKQLILRHVQHESETGKKQIFAVEHSGSLQPYADGILP